MYQQSRNGHFLPGITIVPPPPGGETEVRPTAVPVWVGWYESYTLSCEVLWQPVSSWTDYTALSKGRSWRGVENAVWLYFLNGGELGYVMLLPLLPADLVVQRALSLEILLAKPSTWINALHEDRVSLITLPLLQEWLECEGASASDVAQHYISLWAAVLRATAERTDWFFVVDIPRELKAARECVKQLSANNPWRARGEHVAVYGPHLVLLGGGVVAPSGAVCGVMARVDAEHGIWKAPANEPVAGVQGVEYREDQLFDGFAGAELPINLIRRVPGQARAVKVWGCRTLTPHSHCRYVQVRRTVTWIEHQLRAICQFAVFEPNTLLTWLRLRTSCEAWLRRLWEEGGLMGAEESHAFLVEVGLGVTMTAVEVAAGEIRVKVGIAVLQAAEFLDVHVTLNRGQSVTVGLQPSTMAFEGGV